MHMYSCVLETQETLNSSIILIGFYLPKRPIYFHGGVCGEK